MDEIMKIILQAVCSIAVIIITRYIVPYFGELLDELKKDKFAEFVLNTVYGLQQQMTKEQNEEKKAKAIELAKQYLSNAGLKYADEFVDTVIESSVLQLKLAEAEAKK